METTNVRKETQVEAIEVSRVYASEFQKEGTLTAELKQKIHTKAFYPAKQIANSLSGNIFDLDDFGFEEKPYESTETRVAWIDVPEGSTVESVKAKLAAFPDANIYKCLSNEPVLSDTDVYAINNPSLSVSLDTIANRQVVRYGQNSERAGELILDQNGKVQYKRNAFAPKGHQDIDNRSAEAETYMSPEIMAEFNGISMPSQTI